MSCTPERHIPPWQCSQKYKVSHILEQLSTDFIAVYIGRALEQSFHAMKAFEAVEQAGLRFLPLDAGIE